VAEVQVQRTGIGRRLCSLTAASEGPRSEGGILPVKTKTRAKCQRRPIARQLRRMESLADRLVR
jgi:hypothetical protein